MKLNSPDYRLMDREVALKDFLARVQLSRAEYDPLDADRDAELSFIKFINAGESLAVHNIEGKFYAF